LAIAGGAPTFFNLAFISICIVGKPINENITCGFLSYLGEFPGLAATKLCIWMGPTGLFVLGGGYFIVFFSHLRFCKTYDREVEGDGELK
jgi:hypothetical protein